MKKHYKKSEINLNKKKKTPTVKQVLLDFAKSLIHEEKLLLTAIVAGLFFFGAVIFAGIQLSSSLQTYREAKADRDRVVYELSFWEQVLRIHPDYRDAYFKLALLRYRLGDTTSSKGYVQKALDIDPNFEEGKQLQKLLETK